MKEKMLLDNLLIESTMDSLRKKNFDVVCVDTALEALDHLKEIIPQDASI